MVTVLVGVIDEIDPTLLPFFFFVEPFFCPSSRNSDFERKAISDETLRSRVAFSPIFSIPVNWTLSCRSDKINVVFGFEFIKIYRAI